MVRPYASAWASGSQQLPAPQHGFDCVGCLGDVGALSGLRRCQQGSDRVIESPGSSVDYVEQHVRGIAQREQLGAVCKRERARKLALVVRATRLLEYRGQA
jgi:hypothetical protein